VLRIRSSARFKIRKSTSRCGGAPICGASLAPRILVCECGRIAYGKRIAAWRMGLEVVHDRNPALLPTAFGLAVARRLARELGPMRRRASGPAGSRTKRRIENSAFPTQQSRLPG